MGDRTTESTRNEKEIKDETVKKKTDNATDQASIDRNGWTEKKRENEKGEKKERDSNDRGGKTLF